MSSWLRVSAAAVAFVAFAALLVWMHQPRHHAPEPAVAEAPPAADPAPPPGDAPGPDPDVVAATDEALRAWSSVAKDTPGYLVCAATALAERGPEPLAGPPDTALRGLDLHQGVLSATTTVEWGSEWLTDAAGRTFRVTWSGVRPGERGACSVGAWGGQGSERGPDWRSTADDPFHYDPGSSEDLAAVEEALGRRLASARDELARQEALAASLSGPVRAQVDRRVARARDDVEREAEAIADEQGKISFYRVIRPVISTTHAMLGLTPPPRRDPDDLRAP